jgi:hypothetical protein
LSFVRHPITFEARTDKTLTIAVPSTGTLDTQTLAGRPASVVARALPLRVYYRMDAQVAPGESLLWPIAEVVVPAGLLPSDLGVVGMLEGPSGPIFIPVDVASAKPSPSRGGPIVTFRASTDLDSLQWRLYTSGTSAEWKQAGGGRSFKTGDPISFALDGTPGSILTLEIAARPSGSDFIRTRMQVFLP